MLETGHPSSMQRLDEPARRRLLERYSRSRRPEDLERLVVSYRPLACALAHRYTSGAPGDPDLEQAACEGLVKALQRFDPSRSTPFTSFAVPTILGEVRRYRRDTSWVAHVPRAVQERVREVRAARGRFAAERGREPTVEELSAALACPAEDVVEALSAAASNRTVSLDAERSDEDGLTLVDVLGEADAGYDHVECMTTIERVFPTLPPEERAVIELHFGRELTQRQIAAELHCSRSHVGRLIGSGIDLLRAAAA